MERVKRIKYKGQWRVVVRVEQTYYKLQSTINKLHYVRVRKNHPEITAIEYSTHIPKGKLRFKELSLTTRNSIKRDYESGKYYLKEICEKHYITIDTFRKVIASYENIRTSPNEISKA